MEVAGTQGHERSPASQGACQQETGQELEQGLETWVLGASGLQGAASLPSAPALRFVFKLGLLIGL